MERLTALVTFRHIAHRTEVRQHLMNYLCLGRNRLASKADQLMNKSASHFNQICVPFDDQNR